MVGVAQLQELKQGGVQGREQCAQLRQVRLRISISRAFNSDVRWVRCGKERDKFKGQTEQDQQSDLDVNVILALEAARDARHQPTEPQVRGGLIITHREQGLQRV
jgi:hypothetical protein